MRSDPTSEEQPEDERLEQEAERLYAAVLAEERARVAVDLAL